MSIESLSNLAISRKEKLPPDAEGTANYLSRIGYSLEEALSDIIDNSIDANASNVLVRFLTDGDKVIQVIIADDGLGMNEEELHSAMRYGVQNPKKKNRLGKYGIGLKAASISQCKSLTVLSFKNNIAAGRRWTNESIKDDWRIEIVENKNALKIIKLDWSPVNLENSGTLVIWDRLDSLTSPKQNFHKNLQKIVSALVTDLGLRFHRFITNKGLKLFIDVREAGQSGRGVQTLVKPLDPFGYGQSGQKGYPAKFEMNAFDEAFFAVAHIWPPKSKDENYRLGGGGVSERQGFYFYRHDRLIKAGGWHNLKGDAEPHSSLARVMIDVPDALDSKFRLTVQKTDFVVPTQFIDAVHDAKAGNTTFSDYLKKAEEVYRRAPKEATSVCYPRDGVPRAVSEKILTILKAHEKGKKQPVTFSWQKLEPDQVFDIESDSLEIFLNIAYRDAITGGKNSAADAPVVKILLFFLMEEILASERISAKASDYIDKINECLLEAIKWQR